MLSQPFGPKTRCPYRLKACDNIARGETPGNPRAAGQLAGGPRGLYYWHHHSPGRRGGSRRAGAPPGGRRDVSVTTFRRFRNTDPPALADVWNESLTSRGSFPLSTPALFERWVFSKPYFDPDGLILATEPDGRVIGFALAGFGPNPELAALSHDEGVIGAVLVRP